MHDCVSVLYTLFWGKLHTKKLKENTHPLQYIVLAQEADSHTHHAASLRALKDKRS